MFFKSFFISPPATKGRPGYHIKIGEFSLVVTRLKYLIKTYKMRNLVFKNLTSSDRRKKVVSSCEIAEKQGVKTIIRRHFIYKVIEVNNKFKKSSSPEVYICRTCDHLRQQERLFCRLKASLFFRNKERLFLVLFGHSFKIDLKLS